MGECLQQVFDTLVTGQVARKDDSFQTVAWEGIAPAFEELCLYPFGTTDTDAVDMP